MIIKNKKSILSFIGGVVFGIFLTTLAKIPLQCEDVFFFEEPSPVLPIRKLTIIQVLSDGSAIARAFLPIDLEGRTGDDFMIVAIPKKEDLPFSYHKNLEIPSSQVIRKIGFYRYGIKDSQRTIPIVDFFNK